MSMGEPHSGMWIDHTSGWHWGGYGEAYAGTPPGSQPYTAGTGNYKPVGTPCDPTQLVPINQLPPPWPYWMNTPPVWWTQPAPGSASDMQRRIEELEMKVTSLTELVHAIDDVVIRSKK